MENTPSEKFAEIVAAGFANQNVSSVTRFKTGYDHFVYECTLSDDRKIVVRATTPNKRSKMANAVRLNELLRPLGIPLPAILGTGLEEEFPYIILERLPGVDLGYVYSNLSNDQLQELARELARFQKTVAALPAAAAYGFAPSPDEAVRPKWTDVLFDNVNRSLKRMSGLNIFDQTLAVDVKAAIERHEAELNRIPPTPFLHDITTKNVLITDGRLSGIVDVDDLCFGDSRLTIALTRTSLLRDDLNIDYTKHWLEAEGYADDWLIHLYTAIFSLDLLSEYVWRFNGNEPERTPDDFKQLERICRESLKRVD